MVGNRRKRSESKSKAVPLMPEEPEPLQIINAEAVNDPSELEKNDILDSGVEPVYDSGYDEEEQMTDEIYEEEQMTDEINEEEEFEINDITPNGNADVHTEDEKEEEDEELVSGGSDNEDVHTEDEEEEEEVEEENEDNEEEQEEDELEEQEENEEEEEEEEEPDEDEVEEQEEEEENEEENEEEKDKKLASCGSDSEDVNTFEEVGADVTACVANTNDSLASSEHVLVENLTDNENDDKEANEPMAEEPISIPAENGGDESFEEIISTAVEAKSVAGQGSQPKKKTIRRLIRKRILRGSEGSSISCKAGTSNEANLLCSEDNGVVGVASGEGKTEKIKNEKKVVGKPIVKVNKKLNSIRKGNQHGQSGVQTGSVDQKPKLTNNEPVSKENRIIEHEFRTEEVEKSEVRFTRKQKNKRVVEEGTQIVHAKDIDKPGSSEKGKLWKRVESQGMIFMCSSDTKRDCYRYKVFGLSAAKKDLVSKIYKGMRLFLFDVNLRMLYGIYKASGPGSYDIEPRAFHSQFPSQVRFTVLKDCLPIPEEKFKKVIKDNYFTKTKFDCQLTKDQVKNLCKLFNETAKKSAFKKGGPSQKPRPIDNSSIRVDRKRKRVEDSRRAERGPILSRDPGKRRRLPEQARRSGRTHIMRGQEEMRRPIVVRAREEVRLAPVVVDERYRHPAVIYDRDAYLPPVESSALYEPYRAEDSPRSRIYSYERSPRIDNYRRESAIDYRDHEISRSRESRHYVSQNVHDPYTIYRESDVYHEPVYDSYPSPERRSSKYCRPSDEYRPPLTERRRY